MKMGAKHTHCHAWQEEPLGPFLPDNQFTFECPNCHRVTTLLLEECEWKRRYEKDRQDLAQWLEQARNEVPEFHFWIMEQADINKAKLLAEIQKQKMKGE